MKRLLMNRVLAIISLVLLVYCLSILIDKRISSDNSIKFHLWSANYLLFAILIPSTIILPLIFAPKSNYSTFIFRKEKAFKSAIIICTGILIIWLLLWYGMIGVGKIFDNTLNKSEADEVALSFIKNDSYIQKKIGNIDSIRQTSYTISSTEAKFDILIYGSDTILKTEVDLTRGQNWVVDTLILK
jgi:hypothetical protein